MTLTDATMLTMLADLTATGATFDPAAVFVAPATAMDVTTRAAVQADVHYATGAMATRKAVTTWGSPYKLADGRWAVDGPLCSFRPASAAEAQTLAFWTLSDALTAGNLLAFAPISPAVNLPDENSEWSIIVRLTLDPQGRWSAEVTFNG